MSETVRQERHVFCEDIQKSSIRDFDITLYLNSVFLHIFKYDLTQFIIGIFEYMTTNSDCVSHD